MLKFKQFLIEDTIDSRTSGNKTIWFRIDGGEIIYWDVDFIEDGQVKETYKFFNEDDARIQFYKLIKEKFGVQKFVGESITIPIEIGDTVLGGKFKNKRVVVKSISTNPKGDITINGKSLLRFRIIPQL